MAGRPRRGAVAAARRAHWNRAYGRNTHVVGDLTTWTTLTGRAPAVVTVFNNDGSLTWPGFESPWMMEGWGFDTWMAADPTHRKVVLTQQMVPDGEGVAPSTWRVNVKNGVYDAHYTAWAQNLVSVGSGWQSCIIRLNHEMNLGDLGSTSTDYNNWIASWQRVVTTMRAVNGFNCLFCWCPNARSDPPFANFWPGAAYVDIVGIDSYDWSFDSGITTPEARWNQQLTASNGLADLKALADANDLPMAYGEWGLSNVTGAPNYGGGDDPYYIERMADFARNNNFAFSSFFNEDSSGAMKIDTGNAPNALAAFIARFGSGGDAATSKVWGAS